MARRNYNRDQYYPNYTNTNPARGLGELNPYVSQYAGLPLQETAQMLQRVQKEHDINEALGNRYKQFLNRTKAMAPSEGSKKYINKLLQNYESVITEYSNNGNWEDADQDLNYLATEVASDPILLKIRELDEKRKQAEQMQLTAEQQGKEFIYDWEDVVDPVTREFKRVKLNTFTAHKDMYGETQLKILQQHIQNNLGTSVDLPTLKNLVSDSEYSPFVAISKYTGVSEEAVKNAIPQIASTYASTAIGGNQLQYLVKTGKAKNEKEALQMIQDDMESKLGSLNYGSETIDVRNNPVNLESYNSFGERAPNTPIADKDSGKVGRETGDAPGGISSYKDLRGASPYIEKNTILGEIFGEKNQELTDLQKNQVENITKNVIKMLPEENEYKNEALIMTGQKNPTTEEEYTKLFNYLNLHGKQSSPGFRYTNEDVFMSSFGGGWDYNYDNSILIEKEKERLEDIDFTKNNVPEQLNELFPEKIGKKNLGKSIYDFMKTQAIGKVKEDIETILSNSDAAKEAGLGSVAMTEVGIPKSDTDAAANKIKELETVFEDLNKDRFVIQTGDNANKSVASLDWKTTEKSFVPRTIVYNNNGDVYFRFQTPSGKTELAKYEGNVLNLLNSWKTKDSNGNKLNYNTIEDIKEKYLSNQIVNNNFTIPKRIVPEIGDDLVTERKATHYVLKEKSSGNSFTVENFMSFVESPYESRSFLEGIASLFDRELTEYAGYDNFNTALKALPIEKLQEFVKTIKKEEMRFNNPVDIINFYSKINSGK